MSEMLLFKRLWFCHFCTFRRRHNLARRLIFLLAYLLSLTLESTVRSASSKDSGLDLSLRIPVQVSPG